MWVVEWGPPSPRLCHHRVHPHAVGRATSAVGAQVTQDCLGFVHCEIPALRTSVARARALARADAPCFFHTDALAAAGRRVGAVVLGGIAFAALAQRRCAMLLVKSVWRAVLAGQAAFAILVLAGQAFATETSYQAVLA